MALADRLQETPRRQTGFACSVGALLDTLPADEAQALDHMMNGLGWSQAKIFDAVTAEGHWCSEQQIGHHRARRCRCFKPSAA